MKKLLPIILCLPLFVTGCSAYRTDSSLSFDSTVLPEEMTPAVPVSVLGYKDKSYSEIGKVDAVVKKLSLLHTNPTRQQADMVLGHKAKKLGADAVVDVTYDSSVGLDTWGMIEAEGTAIKFK